MIKPTVGRVVWYKPVKGEGVSNSDQPMAATVAYVWSDNMVNLSIVDHNGTQFGKTSVTLAQDGDDVEPGMCEWMPYQKEQAEKHEDKPKAEGAVAENSQDDTAKHPEGAEPAQTTEA